MLSDIRANTRASPVPALPSPRAPVSPVQFGLRHLFVLTTLAALASALAAAWGPKTFLPSAGMIVAWMNLSGIFRSLQQPRTQAIVLAAAWVMFLISFALPCMVVFGPVVGWQAAWFALTAPLNAISNYAFFHPTVLLLVLINLANLLGALLPLLIWRLSRGQGRWLGASLCLSMVSTWIMWDSPMLIGYYLWSGSFLLALLALPITRPRFVGMAALLALALTAAMFFH